MAKIKWKRICEGCYQSNTGWRIEKSYDGPYWNVFNPEGNRVDTLPTKKRAQEIYG